MDISRSPKHQELHVCQCQNTTSIEDLPEELIIKLMSYLKLKDVINFSVVSRKWLHVPYSLDRMVIKKDEMVKGKGLVRFLIHYMELHMKISPPISLDSFDITFVIGEFASKLIEIWIFIALYKRVRSLFVSYGRPLHISKGVMRSDDEKYVFPWHLLDKPFNDLMVLKLHSITFGCSLTSRWISLAILELCDAVVTENDMDRINSCFPNLRLINFCLCTVPAKMTFAGSYLTRLIVQYSRCLKEIEVLNCNLLKTFWFKGKHVAFSIKDTPNLTKIYFSIYDDEGLDYVFQNLHCDFPIARRLTIVRDNPTLPPLSNFHGRMTSFYQLEKLIFYSNRKCALSLRNVAEVLTACPVLRRLELLPPCVLETGNDTEPSIEYPHKYLSYIKIIGFCTSSDNLRLLKFLLQASEAIDQLVLDRNVEVSGFLEEQHCAIQHGEPEPNALKDLQRYLWKVQEFTFSFI